MDDVELIPDENGRLVAKYLGWTTVDASLWCLSEKLVTLDISHNSLEHLPSDIGGLYRLE